MSSLVKKDYDDVLRFGSQSIISEMVNGKRNVTEDAVDRLIKLCLPDIRREWLLGWDDFKTVADLEEYENFRRMYAEYKYRTMKTFDAVNALIQPKGYKIIDTWQEIDLGKKRSAEENSRLLEEHYKLIRLEDDAVIKCFSPNQLQNFEDDIQKMIADLIEGL